MFFFAYGQLFQLCPAERPVMKHYGYVYTAQVQSGAESKELLIGLPSTLVLRNRYDSDPANRYSFDPATKADYS